MVRPGGTRQDPLQQIVYESRCRQRRGVVPTAQAEFSRANAIFVRRLAVFCHLGDDTRDGWSA
jgi:hypothetical protein